MSFYGQLSTTDLISNIPLEYIGFGISEKASEKDERTRNGIWNTRKIKENRNLTETQQNQIGTFTNDK